MTKLSPLATILSGTFSLLLVINANAAVPEELSRLNDQLLRGELTELRVYSSQPSDGEAVIYEIVPDEDYVVLHPELMCTDSLTPKLGGEIEAAIANTRFTAETAKYAVEWVLQFYDGSGRKHFSALMGTGSPGGFGKNSDPWHVEVLGQSFVAEGAIRKWLVSNYPHAGCTRFNRSGTTGESHGN